MAPTHVSVTLTRSHVIDAARLRTVRWHHKVAQWAVAVAIRFGLRLYLLFMFVTRPAAVTDRPFRKGGAEVLLTGTFYSENWVKAHVLPLAKSRHCSRVTLVTVNHVPPMPKVDIIRPPDALQRAVGAVAARLLTFGWEAMRRRPDFIGGFHLLFNGLAAGIIARLVGAQSIYFCVGGPMEMLDGGIHAENRLFRLLAGPAATIETLLVRTVDTMSVIVTMGTRAREFFRLRGVKSPVHTIAGGIDPATFSSAEGVKTFDFILVGRLVQVKRVDIFLRALADISATHVDVRAVIVGDGPLREMLESLSRELCLTDHVTFAGAQTDVCAWMHRARVFVLTSDSEGLALSMMEAMTCGLPAIVSAVGDLGDLVIDGVNGFLLAERNAPAFAAAMERTLDDPSILAQLAQAASLSARVYNISETTKRWDHLLAVRRPLDAGLRAEAPNE